MPSTFPSSQDVFLTIPTPTITATNLADVSDIPLSQRLQQHSDCISAIESYLLASPLLSILNGVFTNALGGIALSCTNASSVAVEISTTTGALVGSNIVTLTLNNLALGVPVAIRFDQLNATTMILKIVAYQGNGTTPYTFVTALLSTTGAVNNMISTGIGAATNQTLLFSYAGSATIGSLNFIAV